MHFPTIERVFAQYKRDITAVEKSIADKRGYLALQSGGELKKLVEKISNRFLALEHAIILRDFHTTSHYYTLLFPQSDIPANEIETRKQYDSCNVSISKTMQEVIEEFTGGSKFPSIICGLAEDAPSPRTPKVCFARATQTKVFYPLPRGERKKSTAFITGQFIGWLV